MAVEIFDVKQNDNETAFQVTLKDGDGVAVNVTGATVYLFMKHQVTRAIKVYRGSVTLVTAASGIVKHTWATDGSETNIPGLYDAEFEVNYAAGGRQTFPNNKEFALVVRINPEIAS